MKIKFAAMIVLLLSGIACSVNATEYDCMIEPHSKVSFGTQVPGVLDEVLVERGDIIKKGQVLARLKSGVEEAVVAQTKTLLEFLRRKDERNKELFEKNLISAQEKDELETDIRKTEAQLKEAEEKLKLRTILSTINGVVTERSLNPGEYAGETTPILKAAEIDPLNVEVVLPIGRYNAIKRSMNVEIHPERPFGAVYYGEIVIIDKVADAASGTFWVRVKLDNKNYRLPAGLKGKVRFPEK
jgi:membrane fusion protein, multidrug efflux system